MRIHRKFIASLADRPHHTVGLFALVLGLTVVSGFTGCSTETPSAPDPVTVAPLAVTTDRPTPPPSGAGSFVFETKYPYIRTYGTGGGLFIVRIVPGADFTGSVNLELSASSKLNAELTRTTLDAANPIAEITVHPGRNIGIDTFLVSVTASNASMSQTLWLQVDVWDWAGGGSSTADSRQADFIAWIEATHPELGMLSGRNWFNYLTYPGIIIVEHWTYLDDDWEMRVACHMTMPPYDWAKMRLRPRNAWEGILAAQRESDGTIYEIPVAEYPIVIGY